MATKTYNNKGGEYMDIIEQMIYNTSLLRKNQSIFPKILDIHPVLNSCNLRCKWCIGSSEQQSSTVHKLSFDIMLPVFLSIFQDSMKTYWPKEIHFCGNNSETLLNKDFIEQSVDFLQGKALIKIITNGVLLDQYLELIPKIDKINISLDVLSEQDFSLNKGGKIGDFNKILKNITKIKDIKDRLNINRPVIYVSFVISDESFNYEMFKKLSSELRSYGVNHIQVRKDYFNETLDTEDVKNRVISVARELDAYSNKILYDHEDRNTFDIKFNEKANRIQLKQIECKSFWFWPVIAANQYIYPCAHKANEQLNNLGLKLSDFEDYYVCIEEKTRNNFSFICDTPHLCPSNLNYINSQFLGGLNNV